MNQTVLTPPAEYVDELFDALERFFPYIRFSLFTQNDDNTWILVSGKNEDGDNIVLVKGNHDKQIDRKLFTTVQDIMEYNSSGINIVMCHYAMRVWNKKHHGSYHLFGHSHGTLEDFDLSFDCGVDGNQFQPWSLDEVVKKMEEKLAAMKTRGI